ncbi:MAG: pyridoxal phosphate-dependent aminotransferase [Chloroflexi bacterium]|uniref:Aminotransferase n=1 Tax=Candidatus Chlorohelix allophototropha TaxID=3003348 RepID=A0A8T7LTT3_9CHLR|nr:pyridoxal phosphate-dependent aminotransferase [Chloroflexota bacterium]WJW67307.1 pyridoxal phosphate-dependent aminotransferase [Chloroflexota bacterium L227-S17]
MSFAERMGLLGTESAFEVLARAKALEAQGRSIIHLEIGEPDFDTPPHVAEAGIKAIRDGKTHYGPAAGLPEFREAIAAYINRTRGVEYTADQVVVTPGAKPVIFYTIMALIGQDDEAIFPDPGFPIYESIIKFAGGRAISLPLREDHNFRFSLADLEARISPRTRLLIINSPHNPCGSMLTSDDMKGIAELANRHNFWVLSDEIYSRIVYDGEFCSPTQYPGMTARTVLLDGFSKTYAMTGWRLGYGLMPKEMAQKMAQLMVNTNSCTATFTQYAGIAALNGSQANSEAMISEFWARRDLVLDWLNTIPGVTCQIPAGAFYAYPNIKSFGQSAKAIADYLLHEAGVATLSGTAFGAEGEGYLRLSYANSRENLKEALSRMQKAFEGLKK